MRAKISNIKLVEASEKKINEQVRSIQKKVHINVELVNQIKSNGSVKKKKSSQNIEWIEISLCNAITKGKDNASLQWEQLPEWMKKATYVGAIQKKEV